MEHYSTNVDTEGHHNQCSVTSTKVTRCSRDHDSFKIFFLPLWWCCKSTFSSSKIHLIILCISITLHALIFCSFKRFLLIFKSRIKRAVSKRWSHFPSGLAQFKCECHSIAYHFIAYHVYHSNPCYFPSLRPQTTRYRTLAPQHRGWPRCRLSHCRHPLRVGAKWWLT